MNNDILDKQVNLHRNTVDHKDITMIRMFDD